MEFSIKKNLQKAGIAALVAGLSAGTVVLVDALEKGDLDLKKVGIGAALTFLAAAGKSLQNYLKNAIR